MPRTKAAPSVHNMLRTLSSSGSPGEHGEKPVEEVDNDLSYWIEKGYTLFSTHYAGDTPGGIRMLYVLVKNGTV